MRLRGWRQIRWNPRAAIAIVASVLCAFGVWLFRPGGFLAHARCSSDSVHSSSGCARRPNGAAARSASPPFRRRIVRDGERRMRQRSIQGDRGQWLSRSRFSSFHLPARLLVDTGKAACWIIDSKGPGSWRIHAVGRHFQRGECKQRVELPRQRAMPSGVFARGVSGGAARCGCDCADCFDDGPAGRLRTRFLCLRLVRSVSGRRPLRTPFRGTVGSDRTG